MTRHKREPIFRFKCHEHEVCVCVQKIKIPIFHDKNLLNAVLMSFILGGGGDSGHRCALPHQVSYNEKVLVFHGRHAAFQSKKDSELGCSQCQCL
jgi:hypothetical protein